MNEYRCRCGALLPVGGEPQVLARCPSCREPYGFPQFGTDSPIPPSRTSVWLGAAMGAGALTLAALLFAAVWVLTRRTPPREPLAPEAFNPRPKARGVQPLEPGAPPSAAHSPPPAPRESTPARTAPVLSPDEIRAVVVRINRIIARNNMAGIVAAILIHSGRVGEAGDLLAILRDGDQEIGREIGKLPPNFDLKRIAPHHEYGDELVGFGASSLDPARPRPFADDLKSWLRNFQVGSTAVATLRRGPGTIVVSMYFPEAGPEMTELATRATVALGTRETAGQGPTLTLPPPLLQDIRDRLALLPAGYRHALAGDGASRLERLLAKGEGTRDDLSFLEVAVQGDLLPRAEDERRRLQARRADLETKVKSGDGIDTLHFKDGRKLQGKIEEVTDDTIRFRAALGVIRYSRGDILRFERGEAVAAEFRGRFDAARGRPDDLSSLIAWCRERNLWAHKDLVCCAILLADPDRAEPRKELGLAPLGGAPRK